MGSEGEWSGWMVRSGEEDVVLEWNLELCSLDYRIVNQ